MFGIPLPIIKQSFFWSSTVIAETVLGLPLWGWIGVAVISGGMLVYDYIKSRKKPTPVDVDLGTVSFGPLEAEMSVEPYPPLKWYQKPGRWCRKLWRRFRP